MRKIVARILSFSMLVGMVSIGRAADGPPKETVLFNGQDLSGWKHRFPARLEGKMEDTWSVRDGILVCTGKPAGYIQTTEEYREPLFGCSPRTAPQPGSAPSRLRPEIAESCRQLWRWSWLW